MINSDNFRQLKFTFHKLELSCCYLNKKMNAVVLMILVVCLLVSPFSLATDLIVPSTLAPTINAAIKIANSGDSIILKPGVYQENIIINKPITLVGSPNQKSILDGSGIGHVISVSVPNVHVIGLEIRHSGDVIEDSNACIYVKKTAANVILENNKLLQCAFGIWINGSSNPVVINNNITGYQKKFISDRGNGINIWNIKGGLIKGNVVFGVRDGIYLSNTELLSIEDNVMKSVRFGLHYMYNDNNKITGNITCNSKVGQAIMFSKRLLIDNNSVINNSDHGMLLRAIYDSKITNNIAYGNKKGFFINDSDFNEITNNWIENNAIGVAVMAGTEGTTVVSNNFVSNHVQVLYSWRYSIYWNNEEQGNYWSDYLGWDYDNNGIGDRIYYASNRMDHLMHRHPKMRLLALSPVIQLLQVLESRFPVLRAASVIDQKPAMKPTIPTPEYIHSPEKACL